MAKLGDICTIYTGTGFPLQYQGETSGEYPFYKVGDISRNVFDGNVHLKDCDNFISSEVVKKIKGTIVPKDTVVFAKIGEAVKLNRRAITSTNCLVDNNAMGICPDQSKVSLSYFFHYMCNIKLETYAEATTVPSVKKSIIEQLDIPLPSFGEQYRIAGILDSISNLIKQRKQQLTKLDQLVKSRFIEMFGDPLSNSKGWQIECLFSVAPTKQIPFELSDRVWLLNLDAVESNTGTVLFRNIVSKDEVNTSTVMFSTDNVLYSKLRPYLNKVVLPDNKGVATSELLPLCPNKTKLNRVYLCYWLRSDAFVKHISEKVAGAKMPRVSMDYFRSIDIEVPPIELQNQFSVFVEQTDKLKLEVKKSLEKLETLKKSLMQQYFG